MMCEYRGMGADMKRIVVLGLVALFAFALAAPAVAQQGPTDDQLDQCIGDDPLGVGPPTCTYDENGNLLSRDVPGDPSASSAFGTFIVIALLWAGVPLAIAAFTAGARGESVGFAILVTAVLGWIGLAIVLYGQRRTLATTQRVVREATVPTPSDAAARLRKLDDLLAQGVITQTERDTRRAEILDSL
jgi:hypothetical protein